MNFKGFLMSDWGAAHSTAFSAGLDMDMPGNDNFYTFQARFWGFHCEAYDTIGWFSLCTC